MQKISLGIIGVAGYTGIDLVRLLARHPHVEIAALCANSDAGKAIGEIFPHTLPVDLPVTQRVDQVDWQKIDVVFSCLPHAKSQEVIASIPESTKIIDLSADFRIRDKQTYEAWYNVPHEHPKLLQSAIYGLSELYRDALKDARLVACPGCFPTAALLSLTPLAKAGLIVSDDIIIDAKTGATGAGRAAKQQNLFAEVSEAMHAYAVGAHRHAPEIEQELSLNFGHAVIINFTPHLVPMNRCEYLTSYCKIQNGASVQDLHKCLVDSYRDAPFVIVRDLGDIPASRHVRGSNYCHIAVVADRIPGRVMIISTLDNLVKGSGGQGIQNMNIMMGFDETCGLEQLPLTP